MKTYSVLIVGAGASGLFCALTAARQGHDVCVLDPGHKLARKVRIAGGGRCNFTNTDCEARHYLSENPHFCKSALAQFSPWDTLSFFAEEGLTAEEKAEGQMFCEQGGGAVAEMLERCAVEAGARLVSNCAVEDIQAREDGFTVYTDGQSYGARQLVIASGGRSWPALQSSGFAYEMAHKFGLRVVPPRPSLVPLMVPQWPYAELSGLSCRAEVRCGDVRFSDDLLLTHRGLSGPAILQVSSFWNKSMELELNILPQIDFEQEVKAARQEKRAKIHVKNMLGKYLPQRFAQAIAGPLADKTLGDLRREEMQTLSQAVHHWTVKASKTEGWTKAEVTGGGVDTQCLSSKTMQVRSVPGLYFIGECVDVTGWLGGYNLQWAWSSGYAAAMSLKK